MTESTNIARTYLNCTWSEPRAFVNGELWLDDSLSQWCCLALSDVSRRPVPVQPDRCATCPLWQPRAELIPRRPQ